ncbi:MAG TPA: TPM domain-containing protein, partial [Edaphobacter sp.]
MKTILRWLCVVLVLVVPPAAAMAESVSSLPAPTGYVNDFAGVLRPDVKQNLEALITQVDRQANAQIAVVTIKTLDNDQSIEEFATELEDKWKVGNKDDRGVLMIFVM